MQQKFILGVRLSNWPIDRFKRQLARSVARRHEQDLRFANSDLRLEGKGARSKYQLLPPQRKRRWSHQVWIEKPRKNLMTVAAPSARSIANRQSQIANSLVLIRPVAQRELIVACNDAARSHGIRPGMTLGEARALDAEVKHSLHEPHKDAVALEALARWMMRFTPTVALAGAGGGGLSPSPCTQGEGRGEGVFENPKSEIRNPKLQPLPEYREKEHAEHGLFLDLTGCERVFGGVDKIIAHVREAMDRFHVIAHLAVAPNSGAAWALTFSPKHKDAIVDENDLPAALSDLGPAALRLDEEILASLHHLGLNTIGRIVRLPRESLPSRFGPLLLLRIDQAFGRIPEPLIPLEPFSPIAARMDFDGPVDSLEAIWLVFKKLIARLVAQLLKRGHGARAIDVEFFRPYALTLRQSIRLSRASRDPVNLFNLLRCAMEKIETDVGFLGIRLIVTSSQRISDQQIALLGEEEFAGEIELDHLIERLCVRMGQQAIAQAAPVESYVPERAYSWHRRFTRASTDPRATRACPARPLHLLDIPEEIRVIVTPSHDQDGKPVLFARTAGVVHHLSCATGPERISGQWWRGHHKTRDYFDVEDEATGQRFWIFRVQETSKWFLHGEFE